MKTKPYDVVEHLHSEAEIQAYLQEMLVSGASHTAIKYAFMDAERARAKLKHQEPNSEALEALDFMLGVLLSRQNSHLFVTSAT